MNDSMDNIPGPLGSSHISDSQSSLILYQRQPGVDERTAIATVLDDAINALDHFHSRLIQSPMGLELPPEILLSHIKLLEGIRKASMPFQKTMTSDQWREIWGSDVQKMEDGLSPYRQHISPKKSKLKTVQSFLTPAFSSMDSKYLSLLVAHKDKCTQLRSWIGTATTADVTLNVTQPNASQETPEMAEAQTARDTSIENDIIKGMQPPQVSVEDFLQRFEASCNQIQSFQEMTYMIQMIYSQKAPPQDTDAATLELRTNHRGHDLFTVTKSINAVVSHYAYIPTPLGMLTYYQGENLSITTKDGHSMHPCFLSFLFDPASWLHIPSAQLNFYFEERNLYAVTTKNQQNSGYSYEYKDPEMIKCLGFERKWRDLSYNPDIPALKLYLSKGQLSGNDIVYERYSSKRISILERIVGLEINDTREDHRKKYEVCELLLQHGVNPKLPSRCVWPSLTLRFTSRAKMLSIPALVPTMIEYSILRLLRRYNARLDSPLCISILIPAFIGSAWWSFHSWLSAFLALPNSITLIKEEYMQFISAENLAELPQTDKWMLGLLYAVCEEFKDVFSSKVEQTTSSCSIRKIEDVCSEIYRAEARTRCNFISDVLAYGTGNMLKLILDTEPKLDEIVVALESGHYYHVQSPLAYAVNFNNISTFKYLVAAGLKLKSLRGFIDILSSPLARAAVREDQTFVDTLLDLADFSNMHQVGCVYLVQLSRMMVPFDQSLQTIFRAIYKRAEQFLVDDSDASKLLSYEILFLVFQTLEDPRPLFFITRNERRDQILRLLTYIISTYQPTLPFDAVPRSNFSMSGRKNRWVGFTPLMIALVVGDLDLLAVLLRSGAEWSQPAIKPPRAFLSPLELAILNRDAAHPRNWENVSWSKLNWGDSRVSQLVDNQALQLLLRNTGFHISIDNIYVACLDYSVQNKVTITTLASPEEFSLAALNFRTDSLWKPSGLTNILQGFLVLLAMYSINGFELYLKYLIDIDKLLEARRELRERWPSEQEKNLPFNEKWCRMEDYLIPWWAQEYLPWLKLNIYDRCTLLIGFYAIIVKYLTMLVSYILQDIQFWPTEETKKRRMVASFVLLVALYLFDWM